MGFQDAGRNNVSDSGFRGGVSGLRARGLEVGFQGLTREDVRRFSGLKK